MRRYITGSFMVCGLYLLNRFCLIPVTTGVLHDLLVWYGADVLAGALILCILQAVLLVSGRNPVRHYGWVTLFLIGCGLFWEVITPLYLPRSVGDFGDLTAYWLGGSVIWFAETVKKCKREA